MTQFSGIGTILFWLLFKKSKSCDANRKLDYTIGFRHKNHVHN